MKFFRKLITFGLLGMICSSIYSADSTENTLNVAEENSGPTFEPTKPELNPEGPYLYDKNEMIEYFQAHAKVINQDPDVLQGKFWEPSEFWQQPIGKIEHYFYHELEEKYKIYDLMLDRDEVGYPFYDYPEGLEENLENDVEEKLKDFAIEHGIDPNSYNFKGSLMIGRNPEDHIDFGRTIEIEKTTPLLSYFQVCFDYRSQYWIF